MDIIFIGSASSGKSSITKNFGEYLKEKGYKIKRLNLDPAAEYIPYIPDFDIRKYFDFKKYMKEMKLGPNGAVVKIFEEISSNDEILEDIQKTISDCDFSLIDTPGQIEIFIFHESFGKLLKKMRKPIVVFLLDGEKYGKKDFILSKILNLIIYLKYDVKAFSIITKSDRINLKEIREDSGEVSEMYERLEGLFHEFKLPFREILISNMTREGYEELLNMIYEVFCVCGDYV